MFDFTFFEKVMVEDIVPYFDAHYRTLTDRDNRAICGLSLGGFQSYYIGLNHPEIISTTSHQAPATNGSPGGVRCISLLRCCLNKDKEGR